MTTVKIDEYLKKNFCWNSVDLFYAFCASKGIDDPECDMTDDEYDAMEREFCEKVTYDFLSSLMDAVSQDVNERFYNAF